MKDMTDKLKKAKLQFQKIRRERQKEFEEISDFIFRNPELSLKEYLACEYLKSYLAQKGFNIKEKAAGIDTAFTAEKGSSEHPAIAFLAEYDALPYVNSDDIGKSVAEHTCGHNWIAAATVGAAVTLAEMADVYDMNVQLIGTPAEETIGAKVNMIESGVFDRTDVVFQPHLESFTDIDCRALALDAIEFRFFGKATHAASYPHEGINALDAVHLMYSAVSNMRQQLPPEAKISGIISHGGDVQNIIPDYASTKYYVRADKRGKLNEITDWLIDCARGAALMTRCRMDYSFFENRNDEIVTVPELRERLKENLMECGITEFAESASAPTGSSDIGNVSKLCPTMYFEVDIEADETLFTHDRKALKLVNSEYAYRKMAQVIDAMGFTALEIADDAKLLKRIRQQHTKITE